VDWNIERGTHPSAILEFLKKCKADLIFLQKVDLNARRTREDVRSDSDDVQLASREQGE
jgi:hypothetical protein